MAAIPERVQRVGVAGDIVGDKRLRHDGVGATGAGESCGFGKAAELDGDIACALDFVNGVGDLRVADVGLVGGIEEDDSLVGLGVGNPGGELGLGGDGTGGIIRETKIDQIGGDAGHGGHIAVLRCAIEVGDAGVTTVDIGASAASHDIGIDVNRINRIGDGELDVGGEDFLDIAAIALGTVGDKNFVSLDLAATGGVVVLGDGFAQEGIALFGAIALESGALGHLVGGGVQRLDADGRKRLGDVANAEADDRLVGMSGDVGADALGDVGEEIGGFELGVVFVDADHGGKWSPACRV